MTRDVAVLDVGGTHVTAAVVDPGSGRVLRQERAALDPTGRADAVLDAIAEPARSLEVDPQAAWGIAFPGPFDYGAGIGRFRDVAKFEALDGVDVGAALAERLEVPRDHLTFLNDAAAYGLGEWAHGAARGFARGAVITLGTGVGSVFLADGVPVDSGPTVPPDGHAHLIRLADGAHLEDVMSRRALIGAYAARTGRADVDVIDIARAVRDGEAAAAEVWDDALRGLGQALGPWITRFQADAVVIGGSIARSFDLVEAPVRAGLASAGVAPSVTLVRAEHLDDAPLLGAAEWNARKALAD